MSLWLLPSILLDSLGKLEWKEGKGEEECVILTTRYFRKHIGIVGQGLVADCLGRGRVMRARKVRPSLFASVWVLLVPSLSTSFPLFLYS